jgi:hypothetical protein
MYHKGGDLNRRPQRWELKMNATSAFSVAFLALSLAAAPAYAFTSSKSAALTGSPEIVRADFVQGHELLSGLPAREFARSELSREMAKRYFDADVIVTLGALAIASGAFVAAGLAGARRRRTAVQDWRESVMKAVEADVMQFTAGLRRAA